MASKLGRNPLEKLEKAKMAQSRPEIKTMTFVESVKAMKIEVDLGELFQSTVGKKLKDFGILK